MGIQKYGDQIGWGPFVQGDQIFGDHLTRGTIFLGTICPWGPKFDGDRLSSGINFMGIICPGGQEVGDQMSLEPNALQPYNEIFPSFK